MLMPMMACVAWGGTFMASARSRIQTDDVKLA
jgi:hypothetical protein